MRVANRTIAKLPYNLVYNVDITHYTPAVKIHKKKKKRKRRSISYESVVEFNKSN